MLKTTTNHRRLVTLATAGIGAVLLMSACSAPGTSDTKTTDPGNSTSGATSTAASGTPSCGTEPVTLKAYIETGFPMTGLLFDEFEDQFPNVTVDVREDQFAVITQNAPRILADDPPDIMRLPQMSELASEGLLMDLDGYAADFGWDQWPASQLEQLRVAEDGTRGTGPLYGMGLNFSMTGVFYNKDHAATIGMTEAPKTLAEFDELLAKAKDAGITPIMQFNGGATGGFAFPLQNLMASYGDVGPINDWIYLKPGASINTESNLKAAEHMQGWVESGYFTEDANSLDYPMVMSRFLGGDGLFTFTGDWESGNFDTNMAGKVGFFLFPPAEAGGKYGAMSAPLTYGVSAYAENPDCAAFFFDWVATNDEARTIAVQSGGSHPMGPADAFMPEVDPGTTTGETLTAGAQIVADNGAMDFIANATGAIYAQSWTPNLQKLMAGEQTAAGLLESVQADYEQQIAG
ncbi:MAG: extracellular solute-binding protein [Propionibacteriaceae bacterium]|jgi:raffinose/stachyose/melibiose transport system substrate-binding protein|nr:extracellular solute-binding protein [Propionibacteriaceae bacterium]